MNYYALRNVPINQLNRMRYPNRFIDDDDDEDHTETIYSPGTVGSYSSITNHAFNNVYRKNAAQDRYAERVARKIIKNKNPIF